MTGLNQTLRRWLQRPIQRWIKRKLPPAQQVELGLSNIMILPTRLGLGVLVLIALLFMLAINYENSMVFAVCFALIAIWLLALHWTFRSLAGLVLTFKGCRHVHAGDDLGFDIQVATNDQRGRYAIELFWQPQQTTRFDVPAHQQTLQQVFYPTTKRGYLKPERLQVVSYYPLMLFRAWSSVAFDTQALVFPKPLASQALDTSAIHSNQSSRHDAAAGFDELSSVRPYISSDPLHHIAWKASAKRPANWVSKQFEQHQDQRLWLNYQDMPGPDHESKISQLCYWCLQLQQQPVDFGLVLLDGSIEPNRGAKHLINCLTQLALQPITATNHTTGAQDAAAAPR
ncbi:DUF58 domain-containing protein [Neiella sp. HB171785]|uniref:DUF58 domain-containing protein n=1 Tax=Neiella litorisoli TaxID=2771431 RepID=A0A8J6UGT9_9GAMM|nr:DUF58 domain-containing protein [Neiella litorisoli]MBD1390721.1 DUF58 domain-containing protein [Neiella litorisoli]